MEPTNTQTNMPKSNLGKFWGILFVLVVVFGFLYFMGKYNKSNTVSKKDLMQKPPLEVMKNLNDLSKPVVKNNEDRAKELSALSKQSSPVKLTTEQRLKKLENLAK